VTHSCDLAISGSCDETPLPVRLVTRAIARPDTFLSAAAKTHPELASALTAGRAKTPRRGDDLVNIGRLLAETFQRALGLDRVDRRQGLFELGGDSLAAGRIVTMLEQAFNVRLDLQEALASFTVGHVAVLVDAQLVAAVEHVSEDEAVRLLHCHVQASRRRVR